MKLIEVIEARHVTGYTVWLRFSDGAEGEVDLESELYGEVFEPLRDPAVFRSFAVPAELGTLAWPNGADLAPEFLRERIRAPASGKR